jgi:hypothetical protein
MPFDLDPCVQIYFPSVCIVYGNVGMIKTHCGKRMLKLDLANAMGANEILVEK